MDGGVRQDEMAHNIRLEIKTMTRRSRKVNRAVKKPDSIEDSNPSKSCKAGSSETTLSLVDSSNVRNDSFNKHTDTGDFAATASEQPVLRAQSLVRDHASTGSKSRAQQLLPLDTIRSTFYLDHLFGFLYPFYVPSSGFGGRAWILELLTTSAAFQQIVLRYSNHFYPLLLPTESCLNDRTDANKLAENEEAFLALGQSLQMLLNVTSLAKHMGCACRVLTNIIQVYHYEISISNFGSWSTHLAGAVALFKQLMDECLDTSNKSDEDERKSGLNTLFSNIGSSVSCTTQEALRFSMGILIFDDIIEAATSRQEPKLYQHHLLLLRGDRPYIELETVVGVKSCVLSSLGEVASLDVWRHQTQASGSLDGIKLAQRASVLMESLAIQLKQIQTPCSTSLINPLERLGKPYYSYYTPPDSSRLVSQVWIHATIVYLITVVSGWQPANAELRYHVDQLVRIIRCRVQAPLIRTMVWPFCVAGSLADPLQRRHLLEIASTLQPTTLFVTIHKAIEELERIRQQDGEASVHRGLAICFDKHDELPLLV